MEQNPTDGTPKPSPQTQLQILYGQLEDALHEWGQRPATRHRRYEAAAVEAVRVCLTLAGTLERELAEYRETATQGE